MGVRHRGDNSMVKGDTRVKRTQFWKDTEKTVTKESKKETRYYPAEDVKSKLRNNHNNSRQTKLRASITPGTVLILLAGHFKGKRVVFLKQLDSGLLLVTGPFKVNGVPLRRVPESYVIATKTTVDVSKVAVPASVTDALFKKAKTAKKKDEELFFEKDKESSSTILARPSRSRWMTSSSQRSPRPLSSKLTCPPSSR